MNPVLLVTIVAVEFAASVIALVGVANRWAASDAVVTGLVASLAVGAVGAIGICVTVGLLT